MIHELKTWSQYYAAVESGAKKFELRKDDRGFNVGDVLVLTEVNSVDLRPTGRQCQRVIEYIVRDCEPFGLKKGFCILGIRDREDY